MKRVDEVGFTSDSKCMEVKCRENNAEMVYMKGELISSVLLMDSTGMGVGIVMRTVVSYPETCLFF